MNLWSQLGRTAVARGATGTEDRVSRCRLLAVDAWAATLVKLYRVVQPVGLTERDDAGAVSADAHEVNSDHTNGTPRLAMAKRWEEDFEALPGTWLRG